MKVTILKAFPYAHDGISIRNLVPSDRDPPELEEIHDQLIAGLVAEGYISTGQGVGHVLQQAAADHVAVDGPDVDDRAGPAEGLTQEGARAAGAEEPAPLIEIPAEWKILHWTQRVAMAKALGWVDGEPTADQANGWISDILVHRERRKPLEALGGLSIADAHDALTKAGVEWTAETTVADLAALLDTVKGLAGASESADE